MNIQLNLSEYEFARGGVVIEEIFSVAEQGVMLRVVTPGGTWRVDRKTLSWNDGYIRVRKKGRQIPRDVFLIRRGRPEWDKDQWEVMEKLEDLEAAKAALAIYKRETSPFRFMMKKEVEMGTECDYDDWAAFRFSTGEWVPVPWAKEPWATYAPPFHHAHLSVDGRVLFWRSPQEAQADATASSSKPGSYLKAYFGDVLTPRQIEEWVHKADPPGEIEISGTDPESIYEAYRSVGHSSCMAYEDGSSTWATPGRKSPVRVYGAGDLAVALLRRQGQIVARALVWPEKKVAGRQYGDDRRMRLALKEAGYTLDGGEDNCMDTWGSGNFSGARLLKIPSDNSGEWVMPYIDLRYGVKDEGDHFILHRDYDPAHNTDGTLYGCDDDASWCCASCGGGQDEDEGVYVVDGDDWCYNCYFHHAGSCEHCEGSFSETVTVDDQEWCARCADLYAHSCDECDELTVEPHDHEEREAA